MTTFLALSELLDPVRARVHTIALDKDAAKILGFTYVTVANSGELFGHQFFAAPDERAARMTHDLVADQLKRRRSPMITKCEACNDPMTGKLGLCPTCIQKPPAPVKKATALKAAPAKKAAPPPAPVAPEPEPEPVVPAPEPEAVTPEPEAVTPEPEAVTPEPETTNGSGRRVFTPEFKAMIVEECRTRPVAQVARERGLSETPVRKWIKAAAEREPVGVPA